MIALEFVHYTQILHDMPRNDRSSVQKLVRMLSKGQQMLKEVSQGKYFQQIKMLVLVHQYQI